MAADHLQRLQAAAIDGRAHNVYFRQTQLERLCKGLLSEETALRQAMTTDSNYTPSEAIVVLHAAIQVVHDAYTSLQPAEALQREYRIAHGQDAQDNEVPYGLVYIEPEAHTLLYSICSPLSAAIAAGNCVALLLENNLRELSGLIRKILTEALDADTFAIVTSPVKDDSVLDNAMSVRQADGESSPKSNELLSPATSTAVAVVDRTADIALAARELVRARSAFGGRSPYGPDVILVNEFVLEDLLKAVLNECGSSGSSSIDHTQTLAENKGAGQSFKVDLRKGTLSATGSNTSLDQGLQAKSKEPVLLLQPFRSLDDAINFLDGRPMSLAAYHFCNLKSAKYLSQFVAAEITFVNQIPRQLFIGPAAPKSRSFDLQHRYPVSLFSQQRPAFVQPGPKNQSLADALSSDDNASAQALLREIREPLKAMKRSEGGGVGFFEQGFLMNASFILVSVVTLSATGAWQLWRFRSSR